MYDGAGSSKKKKGARRRKERNTPDTYKQQTRVSYRPKKLEIINGPLLPRRESQREIPKRDRNDHSVVVKK